MGPDGQDDGCGDGAYAAQFEELGRLGGDDLGQSLTVLEQLLIEHEHALGQSDCLSAGGRRPDPFLATSPSSDGGDLLGSQRLSGIDAEVVTAQHRGQCVDAPGPLDVEVLTGDGEDPQRGVRLTGAAIT
nr:hypothetical protein [Janibacter indicus]